MSKSVRVSLQTHVARQQKIAQIFEIVNPVCEESYITANETLSLQTFSEAINKKFAVFKYSFCKNC